MKKENKSVFGQLLLMFICALVLYAATVAYFTKAWYANNNAVDGNNSVITSDSASPSLYIREGTDTSKTFATAVNFSNSTKKLFPISTGDLINWYYVSKFQFIPRLQENYIVNSAYASQYTKVSNFISPGTYYNTYEEANKVAFIQSDVNLYTSNGSLDIYLLNNNPIEVSYAENTTEPKRLLEALRVGLFINNTAAFIYAPITESGTGNSTGAAADTFYCISNGNLTSAPTLTSLTNYLAAPVPNTDFFTPTGTTSLGTATETGLPVSIFIWLEGTDAQALYGMSDNDIKGINISIHFVGVESSGS